MIKFQIPNKFQYPISKQNNFEYWIPLSIIGNWSLFDYWDLELGYCRICDAV